MPGLIVLLLVWGILAVVLISGVIRITQLIKAELRQGHWAVLVYGPLILAAIFSFGVWLVRSWLRNWGI